MLITVTRLLPSLEHQYSGPGQAAHDPLRDLGGGVAHVVVVHRDQLVPFLDVRLLCLLPAHQALHDRAVGDLYTEGEGMP